VLSGEREGLAAGRRVAARVLEAEARARQLVEAAEQRAAHLLGTAERESASVRLRAEEVGRANGAAALAAKAVALATAEASADARQLERVTELARVLAERLLGEALTLDPGRVVALARQVLAEARAARSIRFVAHPSDAAELAPLVEECIRHGAAAHVEVDQGRARGSVKVVTETGELDGEIAPQLTRLAARLREALSE
jgi:flagellar assembly protein FliH/type III secretion protein L